MTKKEIQLFAAVFLSQPPQDRDTFVLTISSTLDLKMEDLREHTVEDLFVVLEDRLLKGTSALLKGKKEQLLELLKP